MPEIPASGLILILGGARSGKSSFAERIARETGLPALFIATAAALDDEMRDRIASHRAARPSAWRTLEVQTRLGAALQGIEPPAGPVILDCVTLWVSNILLSVPEETPAETRMQQVQAEVEAFLVAQRRLGGQWLLVSNEVGMGIVPAYPLGRIYRDALGWANQRLAQEAARVILMVAGIPLVVK
ncbi:MAG: bifunctional adenosylcobinamide kinase/adenosylcobinamide-phosphate guanylyltransferase [Anaerolineales bacterium]|nr:bifunctional adenosylcobinamide kinase/adenosylcobinamide-phosphate guanylyltransferase [Anaerolineales bacterium]MCX7755384.1 bifunctional adenosylcobinamide kinase/adenosylcobinamide-phosphate guanylyltransferase [Anaerolineales bacterium]MDW8278572.1 bifunctional adenosylcobinamide kinase/adenosylcobinamide-phosphate guanylyltransferase [Anaerolineales bacterium]